MLGLKQSILAYSSSACRPRVHAGPECMSASSVALPPASWGHGGPRSILSARRPRVHVGPECTPAPSARRPRVHAGPECTSAPSARRPRVHAGPECTPAPSARRPRVHAGPECTSASSVALPPATWGHGGPRSILALKWPFLPSHCDFNPKVAVFALTL